MSRIGFDVDGVLADFIPAYMSLLVQVTGKNLFHHGDAENPPCWDWDLLRGYTPEEIAQAWGTINASPDFWLKLEPTAHVSTLAMLITELERRHEVYFITARRGDRIKRQTEIWLLDYLCYPMRVPGVYPTVLISANKGGAAHVLKLDAYIDDRLENVNDVAVACPSCRPYLLDRAYNHHNPLSERAVRVATLGEMFDIERNHGFM